MSLEYHNFSFRPFVALVSLKVPSGSRVRRRLLSLPPPPPRSVWSGEMLLRRWWWRIKPLPDTRTLIPWLGFFPDETPTPGGHGLSSRWKFYLFLMRGLFFDTKKIVKIYLNKLCNYDISYFQVNWHTILNISTKRLKKSTFINKFLCFTTAEVSGRVPPPPLSFPVSVRKEGEGVGIEINH